MATTSETTYTHTCDLCEQVTEKDQLRHLYGPADHSRGINVAPPKIDICAGCLDKPIDLVLAFFKQVRLGAPAVVGLREPAEPKTIRVRGSKDSLAV